MVPELNRTSVSALMTMALKKSSTVVTMMMMVVLFLAAETSSFAVPRGAMTRSMRLRSSPQDLLDEAARLRAEVAAESPSQPISTEDAKERIQVALKKATQMREKDQLRIALTAAEEAGFSGSDPVVQKAVRAYNELTDLSDSMRKRLVKEAQAQGGDPTINWNPGYTYAGIFVVMSLLVILGGKGIFY